MNLVPAKWVVGKVLTRIPVMEMWLLIETEDRPSAYGSRLARSSWVEVTRPIVNSIQNRVQEVLRGKMV
jgi:hypothetical protein